MYNTSRISGTNKHVLTGSKFRSGGVAALGTGIGPITVSATTAPPWCGGHRPFMLSWKNRIMYQAARMTVSAATDEQNQAFSKHGQNEEFRPRRLSIPGKSSPARMKTKNSH